MYKILDMIIYLYFTNLDLYLIYLYFTEHECLTQENEPIGILVHLNFIEPWKAKHIIIIEFNPYALKSQIFDVINYHIMQTVIISI